MLNFKNFKKIILVAMTLILALSMFGCSRTPDESSDTSSTDISVSIDTISQEEQETPSYFKGMKKLIEAKSADEDGLFERFENIPLVYIADANYDIDNAEADQYTLEQIAFYPEYEQISMTYKHDKAFVSILSSKEDQSPTTNAEVVAKITICGETVDLHQSGVELYWGSMNSGDLHIYITFSMSEDIESLEQLFVQSTLAEMMQANN